MLDELYFKSGHLTAAAFEALEQEEVLTDEDKALMLAHLENCRSCMSDYVETLTGEHLLAPPEGLEERIVAAVRQEFRQECSRERRRRAKIIQVTKLAVAVCLTMVLFYGGTLALRQRGNYDFVFFDSPRIAQHQQNAADGQTAQDENTSGSTPVSPRKNNDVIGDFLRGFNENFSKFADSFNFSTIFQGDGK